MSLSRRCGCILTHSSSQNCFNSATLEGFQAWKDCLRSCHSILIRFKSSLWLGHSKTLIFFLLSHSDQNQIQIQIQTQTKIKSNHFYCHITTAHVPWWVKFLRACSRQCRNNLQMDSTYLQTYTYDNVQNIHTYTQYMWNSVLFDIQLSIHITHRMYTLYIMYTDIHKIICEGATDYT